MSEVGEESVLKAARPARRRLSAGVCTAGVSRGAGSDPWAGVPTVRRAHHQHPAPRPPTHTLTSARTIGDLEADQAALVGVEVDADLGDRALAAPLRGLVVEAVRAARGALAKGAAVAGDCVDAALAGCGGSGGEGLRAGVRGKGAARLGSCWQGGARAARRAGWRAAASRAATAAAAAVRGVRPRAHDCDWLPASARVWARHRRLRQPVGLHGPRGQPSVLPGRDVARTRSQAQAQQQRRAGQRQLGHGARSAVRRRRSFMRRFYRCGGEAGAEASCNRRAGTDQNGRALRRPGGTVQRLPWRASGF